MSVKILEAGESAASVAAPTPSETIIRAAPARKVAEITLPSGRVFGVRRLGPLDRMLASKAIGSEFVTNALYANYALVACSVTSIDRSPVSMPSSQTQIEALVYRIGDDWDDLTEEMNRAFKPAEADAPDLDSVKN